MDYVRWANLDSRILDASGFYAGIPFASSEKFFTTSLIFEEIKHIKKNQDVLGVLLETNRLEIKEPEKKYTELITKQAAKLLRCLQKD